MPPLSPLAAENLDTDAVSIVPVMIPRECTCCSFVSPRLLLPRPATTFEFFTIRLRVSLRCISKPGCSARVPHSKYSTAVWEHSHLAPYRTLDGHSTLLIPTTSCFPQVPALAQLLVDGLQRGGLSFRQCPVLVQRG